MNSTIVLPTGPIEIPCTSGEVSDGYHTFDELYLHRCLLFFALQKAHPEISWRSKFHADGTCFEGWFICGINLPTGQVTYHAPLSLWRMGANHTQILDSAPPFDGHTQEDVLKRLEAWISTRK